MANTFTVTIPDDVEIRDGVAQVKNGVEGAGGDYEFDGRDGRFSVKGVTGSFSVDGRDVTITIEKKPFVVSHAFVERAIRGYFA